MKILCCIKVVPEKDARVRVDGAGSWIAPDGLAYAISECDRYAVEAALRLKEAAGGEVCVLSLGGARVSKGIKEALAMGCDRAIHVDSEALERHDALGIAEVLAKAVADEGFDVVFTGQQSDDLGYNAVGPVLAEQLGMSHAQIVLTIEPAGDAAVTISHELDNSLIETVEIPLPVVLGVQSGINDVRYASLKGIMGAASKPQKKLSLEDLGFPAEGPAARLVVESVAFPERSSTAEILEGSPAEMADALVRKLKSEAKVL